MSEVELLRAKLEVSELKGKVRDQEVTYMYIGG